MSKMMISSASHDLGSNMLGKWNSVFITTLSICVQLDIFSVAVLRIIKKLLLFI